MFSNSSNTDGDNDDEDERINFICELFIDEDQSSLFKQGYLQKSYGLFEAQSLSEMYPFMSKPIANTNN